MRPVGGIIIRETFIHISRGLVLKSEYYIDKPIRPDGLLGRIDISLKKWVVKHWEILEIWDWTEPIGQRHRTQR